MDGNSGVTGYTDRERRSVALSATLGFWLDFYDLVIIAFLIVPIQKSLGISLTQAGALTSVTLLGSVAGGIFFGWLGDKIGRKPTLLWTLALFAAGSALTAFSWDFESLLSFRFLAGLGIGGEWAAGMVLFNEVWNPKKRGFGSGVVQAMSAVGAATASIVAVWALSTFSPEWGWRIALLSGGAPIFLMVYVRFWMPESQLWMQYDKLRRAGELPPEKLNEKASVLEVFRGASCKYTILGAIAVGAAFFGYQSGTVFTPTLMIKELGTPPAMVRNVTLVFAVFMGCGMLLAGWFSDRYGRKPAAVVPNLITILGFLGMYTAGHMGYRFPGSIWLWPFFWGYMVWALGQSAQAMFGPWFSELFPVELRAAGTAVAFNIGRGIGAIAPFAVPMVAKATGGSLLNGMMVGIIGSITFFVVAMFLPETAGRVFAVVERKEREPVEAAI